MIHFRISIGTPKPLFREVLNQKLAAKAAGKPLMLHAHGANKNNLLAVAFANSMANKGIKPELKKAASAVPTSVEIIKHIPNEETTIATDNELGTSIESIELMPEEMTHLAAALDSASNEIKLSPEKSIGCSNESIEPVPNKMSPIAAAVENKTTDEFIKLILEKVTELTAVSKSASFNESIELIPTKVTQFAEANESGTSDESIEPVSKEETPTTAVSESESCDGIIKPISEDVIQMIAANESGSSNESIKLVQKEDNLLAAANKLSSSLHSSEIEEAKQRGTARKAKKGRRCYKKKVSYYRY